MIFFQIFYFLAIEDIIYMGVILHLRSAEGRICAGDIAAGVRRRMDALAFRDKQQGAADLGTIAR
ncbi:hypothetical protein EAO27_19615 [Sphingopyxis sp. YF1]|nr:hypothetical protein EAO27_19615 [Sphingopyxis sp. YF1]